MKCRNLILIVCILVPALGCKVEIEVPSGGKVTTKSGNYRCGAGKTCVIDVADLFFDEVFVARPAPGYVFSGWRKKERAFCGGTKSSCQITSSFLGIDPLLMALLDSEEVFFLQPVFSESTGEGPVGNLNAAVCFNPSLHAVGSTFVADYRLVTKASGAETRTRTELTVTGPANFKGKQAMRSIIDTTILPDVSPTSTTTSGYTVVDTAKKRETELGGESETFIDGVLSSTASAENVPGILFRFDLNPGESYSQTYTTNLEFNSGGVDGSSTSSETVTTTYIGVVKVVVPAGTFQACKFREITETNFEGIISQYSRTIWYGVDNGVQLQDDDEFATGQLLSATIDGQSI